MRRATGQPPSVRPGCRGMMYRVHIPRHLVHSLSLSLLYRYIFLSTIPTALINLPLLELKCKLLERDFTNQQRVATLCCGLAVPYLVCYYYFKKSELCTKSIIELCEPQQQQRDS
jgi:hypothetical protein